MIDDCLTEDNGVSYGRWQLDQNWKNVKTKSGALEVEERKGRTLP